jgi:hypothetical protein
MFLFFIGIIAIVILLLKWLIPSNTITCTRCDGKGFWLAARGREKCDWCRGTGRLPRTSR